MTSTAPFCDGTRAAAVARSGRGSVSRCADGRTAAEAVRPRERNRFRGMRRQLVTTCVHVPAHTRALLARMGVAAASAASDVHCMPSRSRPHQRMAKIFPPDRSVIHRHCAERVRPGAARLPVGHSSYGPFPTAQHAIMGGERGGGMATLYRCGGPEAFPCIPSCDPWTVPPARSSISYVYHSATRVLCDRISRSSKLQRQQHRCLLLPSGSTTLTNVHPTDRTLASRCPARSAWGKHNKWELVHTTQGVRIHPNSSP